MGVDNTLASIISERALLAALAGITFQGQRDSYEELGYQRVIRCTDMRLRAERDGIARRVVELPAKATWRHAPDIWEDDDPNSDTDFEKAVKMLADRLKLWSYCARADRLAGYGRYGVIFLGVQGAASLDAPLTGASATDIQYLAALSEDRAPIQKLVDNKADPRFNLPEFYSLDFTTLLDGVSPSITSRVQGTKVHWSRVIHIAEDLGPDEIYGTPRMLGVWNYLDDLAKVSGGSAEAFWRAMSPIVAWDVDKDITLSDGDKTDMKAKLEELKHKLDRYIRTQGVTPKTVQVQQSDPEPVVRAIVSLISGGTGIPQRLFFGSERGDLASTQDRSNWNDRIAERQSSFAEPVIVRGVLDRFIQLGALPQPTQYKAKWAPVNDLTPSERADVVEKTGRGLSYAATPGAAMAPSELRTELLGLPAELPADAIPITAAAPAKPAIPARDGTPL